MRSPPSPSSSKPVDFKRKADSSPAGRSAKRQNITDLPKSDEFTARIKQVIMAKKPAGVVPEKPIQLVHGVPKYLNLRTWPIIQTLFVPESEQQPAQYFGKLAGINPELLTKKSLKKLHAIRDSQYSNYIKSKIQEKNANSLSVKSQEQADVTSPLDILRATTPPSKAESPKVESQDKPRESAPKSPVRPVTPDPFEYDNFFGAAYFGI